MKGCLFLPPRRCPPLSRASVRFKALYARTRLAAVSTPNIITLVLRPCQIKSRLRQMMKSRPKASAANPKPTVNKPKMIFLNNINFSPLRQRLAAENFRRLRAFAAQPVITHVVLALLNHGAHGLLHSL